MCRICRKKKKENDNWIHLCNCEEKVFHKDCSIKEFTFVLKHDPSVILLKKLKCEICNFDYKL